MKKKTSGIDWKKTMMRMAAEPWQDDDEPDRQVRLIYLGERPSGKFYLPFACSNLDPCPVCGGKGKVPIRASRKARGKAAMRLRKLERRFALLAREGRRTGRYEPLRRFNTGGRGWQGPYPKGSANYIRARLEPIVKGWRDCGRCGGCGSHEAHDDEVLTTMVEREAESHGFFITGNDSIASIYLGECRDKPRCDSCHEYFEDEEDLNDSGLCLECQGLVDCDA